MPVATLRYWRHLGSGPQSFRIGRTVRYWRSDVLQWLEKPVESLHRLALSLATVGVQSDDELNAEERSKDMAGNIAKRTNGKWRARYRDESGKEHSRHFDRKIDAQHWLDQVTSTVVTGTYADPEAGRITFAAFFGEWSTRQVWAPGTVLAMSLAARSVPFAGKPMKQIRRSEVETWIKQMDAAGLAPGTIKTRYVNVRSVFRAAVKDRVIGSDPTDGVRLPRGRRADVAMSIPTPEEVGLLMAVADAAVPAVHRALRLRRPATRRGRRGPTR